MSPAEVRVFVNERGVSVPAGASADVIEAAALASEAFIRLAEGRAARKVVVVPGRLVNVVV